MSSNRNISIDAGRLVAAFLVVCLHTKLPNGVGAIMADIGKIAVPFFLLVSGYYLYSNDENVVKERSKKGIRNVLFVILEASLVYALLRFVKYYFYDLVISDFNFLKFVLLNDFLFTEHLWYLFAYLYVLITLFFITKYKLLKYVFILLPIFLIFLIVFTLYSRLVPISEGKFLYELNWLVTGIPYVFLGMWMKKSHVLLSNLYIKYKKYATLLILLLFLGLFVEHYLIKKILGEGPGIFTTLLLASFLFIRFSLDIPVLTKNIDIVLAPLGRVHALNIYIYHVLIREIIYLNRGYKTDCSFFNNSITIFFLSLLLSIIIEKLKKNIESSLKKKSKNNIY